MDGQHFDQIARWLAEGTSRRKLLRAITGTLAGTALVAQRPAKDGETAPGGGGPSPCSAYCAGEPGPRGAQCRQACKACGGPTSPSFCYDERSRNYTCCADGQLCFNTSSEVGPSVICCDENRQVCDSPDGPFCCANGTLCSDFNLCCASGLSCGGTCCDTPDEGCCYDRDAAQYVCGESCYDVCGDGRGICGINNEEGYCAHTRCYSACQGSFQCGTPDENGNCSDTRCFDLCSGASVCGIPNQNGNCAFFSCFNMCDGADNCGSGDENGNCFGTACFDPSSETMICGESCNDLCLNSFRCGTTGPLGYCAGTACIDSLGFLRCGTPGADGIRCVE
jgi:hypothetical protein